MLPKQFFCSYKYHYFILLKRPAKKKGTPLNAEEIVKEVEEQIILQTIPLNHLESMTKPIDSAKNANLKPEIHNFVSKTIVSDKLAKDEKIVRCKSDLKNQENVEITLLKLDTKVENMLAVQRNKNLTQNKAEELFVHQSSYIGEVVSISNKEVVNQLLSLKQNSITISPDQPIVEEKKLVDKEKSAEKIPTLVDHALNEKSKKKFNPEIFVQLKTGTISTHYKLGQVLGEGS